MTEIGYSLSSEEHSPQTLIQNARRAEEAGFSFALISDHYHPWVGEQGQSAFVWAVIGGIAQVTERLRLGTGVTCPMMRMHPAIVAQAAATAAVMMPGRFFLGVGSGENLNEHVTGERWPDAGRRLDMLEEAVAVVRRLLTGDKVTHHGRHFTVDEARLFTVPTAPLPIYLAAGAPQALELAGRIADGLISTTPKREVIEKFDAAGGSGKPRIAHLTVCWDGDEATARRTAHRQWPNAGLHGDMTRELKTPAMFEQAAKLVREEDVAKRVVCGPDPDRHREAIQRFVMAGYDHVYVHQIGPDQEGFMDFYRREILPAFT